MALINWNESYSVKIKEIDSQHKKLVDLINQLHDKMKEGKGKDAVGSVLDELVKYTVYHFSYEESLFAKYSYPEMRTHARSHSDLIEQVKVYVKDFQAGNGVLPMDLMSFLKKWLVDHISGEDKKYTPFLNAKGVS